MKSFRIVLAAIALAASTTLSVQAEVSVGKPAPEFTATGSDGKSYKLADYKGKFVVLQWYNRDCPFIVKHYQGGNMQALQEKYGKQGVVWFEINSSAEGKEGYFNAADSQKIRKEVKSKSLATLLDPSGEIGRLYKAKTTPHMFIIDPQGTLVYDGAIDDHPTPYAEDIPKSKNYVSAALDEALAGKMIAKAKTRPYGCGVKYN